MAQFDVFKVSGILVVDLQTDLIDLDETRVVAPLLDSGRYAQFPKLTPVIQFQGQSYVVRVQQLAAIRGRDLGQPIGSLREHADELLRAIDILTRGF